MSATPFHRKTLRWLILTFVISFAAGLALMVFGPEIEQPSSRAADGLSTSAIGHRAFIELLRELDIPVVLSRHATAKKAGRDALLVVAAPLDCPRGSPREEALQEMLDGDCAGLLVLPKWKAEAHPQRRDWVVALELISKGQANEPLRAIGSGLQVQRVRNTALGPWNGIALGVVPSLPLPEVQLLLEGNDLEPLVYCNGGVLLGAIRRGGRRIHVLSDPDILCNGGIGHRDNAAFVVAVVERLRRRGGAVVLDETLHGHEIEPSIWRELFTFPLVVLMIHALLVLIVLLAAGMQRFGAPERAEPVLEPGHRFLIENTADLLRYRGQPGAALTSYFKTTLARVRTALRAPRDLDAAALEAWLDRVGATRGTTDAVGDLHLATRTTAAESGRGPRGRMHMVRTADRIYRWREEILHGPSDRTRHP